MTREEAIKILNKYDLSFCEIGGNPIPPQDIAEAIYMAIEALQAEPKAGEWIDVNGDGSLWRCNRCKEISCCNDNFCPNCGAKMDKE